MAKTYTAAGTVSAGDVATAAAWNIIGADVNNLIVPPAVMVVRTSDLSSYTGDTAITWNSSIWDTDTMFTSGTNVTINTAGIYIVTLNVYWQATATVSIANANFALNGNSVVGNYSGTTSGTAGWGNSSMLMNLSVSDVITGRVGFAGGSAYIVKGNAASQFNQQTRMGLSWIGRTS